jgi:hypothetical protein
MDLINNANFYFFLMNSFRASRGSKMDLPLKGKWLLQHCLALPRWHVISMNSGVFRNLQFFLVTFSNFPPIFGPDSPDPHEGEAIGLSIPLQALQKKFPTAKGGGHGTIAPPLNTPLSMNDDVGCRTNPSLRRRIQRLTLWMLFKSADRNAVKKAIPYWWTNHTKSASTRLKADSHRARARTSTCVHTRLRA